MRGYCCQCEKDLDCEVVSGDKIYPHRPDLYAKEFVRCPNCGNYTSKTLGEHPVLPTEHIRRCRRKAHALLDTIWKDKKLKNKYYSRMSNLYNRNFHWGEIRSDTEADEALEHTATIIKQLGGEE